MHSQHKKEGVFMTTSKLVYLTSLLLMSGLANAATPCNGFQIEIANKLADDLIGTKIKMSGAELQPNGIEKLPAKSSQVYTVNKSKEDVPMVGEFVYHTLSLPSKQVSIKFDLKNAKLVCEHNDQPQKSDYAIDKARYPNKVHYTISNK